MNQNPYFSYAESFQKLTETGKQLPFGKIKPEKKTVPEKNAPVAMILSPHPDDECIVGALPIRLMREAGFRIVNCAVTLGSKVERREERLAELQSACKWIGYELEEMDVGELKKVTLESRQSQIEHWQSFVEKVIFDGKKAIGIRVKIKNKVQTIYANKEVILSGGSINSPQLLMVSGVGPADHLKEKGIEIVHELKGVGKNLQDHLETYIQQECNTPDTLYSYVNKLSMMKIGIQWFLNKSGPCSTSFLEAGGFCKSSSDKDYPNIQFHFFPAFVIDHGLVDPDRHGFQLHASLNQPKSRGEITLNSSNPYDYPKIQFNYLKEEYDLEETVKCVHVAREILKQSSMKPYAGKEIGPGEKANSDEEIREYIRSKAETAYHPSCTLKMGIDDMAVVDEKLKIHGLQNIRVADASIMPEITSGNLNAPTLMIGERAADFIQNQI